MIEAKPFLKWAGGKRQLAPTILEHAPRKFGRYFEPFLGAGAVFFALRPERAMLGDVNQELVTTFYGVAFDMRGVELELYRLAEAHRQNDLETFMAVRKEWPAAYPPYHVAARMIYLNRTCFNGVYRVNKKNEFNVPIGDRGKAFAPDFENLKACSALLAKALGGDTNLFADDYMTTTDSAERGDFVYIDPPYMPASKTASFTAFSKDGFNDEAQEVLSDHVRHLAQKGVHVIASNSDTPRVRELYKGMKMIEVSRRGTVSSKAGARGRVGELLILGGAW